MRAEIILADIKAVVSFKDIKNIHLSVHPPEGDVTVSAPLGTNTESIRCYLISKLPWIREQKKKLESQERESPRELIDRESHYLWGKRYLLKLDDECTNYGVELTHSNLILKAPSQSSYDERSKYLESFYRRQLRHEAEPLIEKWSRVLGIAVPRLFVQSMKRQWGSCNVLGSSIRLNIELSRKPTEFLGYVVLHELIHFIEPNHGSNFFAHLDRHMPGWQPIRGQLNQLPLSEAQL